MAPASDLTALASSLEDMPGGSLFGSYVVQSYAQNYPDVKLDDYIKLQGRLPIREMAGRCLSSPSLSVSVLEAVFIGNKFYAQSPDSGALGRHLAENTMRTRLDMPLLLAQGDVDTVINPKSQVAYAGDQCRLGSDTEFHMYPGKDHLTLVADGSPAIDRMLAWTRDRIDAAPTTPNCGSTPAG
ncbi:MAG: lipase family protein [Gordonia sp. (in: high G+C Gram-positive bacteria)]|uniref:hypothetical protein n=1 Tax=Gordonia sp. (in: high G+C Gram-positive bacteria) TaxID=84139 RepID=UPI0039E5E96A